MNMAVRVLMGHAIRYPNLHACIFIMKANLSSKDMKQTINAIESSINLILLNSVIKVLVEVQEIAWLLTQ